MANNNLLVEEYIYRINKVFDYIEKNIDKQFTLEELSSVSCFSKFHFHRIFLSLVGETPFQFIQRIRLEKSASNLILNPKESISEIAVKYGFTDISIFSRNFKSHFKKSATEWRIDKSNLSQIKSNNQKVKHNLLSYFCPETKTIKWKSDMKQNKSAEVKELQTITVAYIRHIGPYKGNDKLFDNLWSKICSWAGARGLMQKPDLQFIVMYHDDPNITPDEKLRMSVCLSVPQETKVEGEVGKMVIEGGKYVVARFELKGDEFQQAWEWVYGSWLPSSGYVPDDKPCFEVYPQEPKNGIYVVDICVPVKLI